METIREKIAYLKGIMDGDTKFGEERVRFMFQKMLELLGDISEELDTLGLVQAELEDYVEEIDLDLAELEDEYYAEEHECCGHHHDHDHDHGYDPMVRMECPECGEEVQFEEEFLYDDDVRITCPNCGGTVFDSEELDEEIFSDLEEDDED